MVGRKHCVWLCCDNVVGMVIFQASCGCKVIILNAESYYVTGIGVQGLKLGALSCCVGLLLIPLDEERAAERGRAVRRVVDMC